MHGFFFVTTNGLYAHKENLPRVERQMDGKGKLEN